MHQHRRPNRKSHGCPTGKKRFRDHRAAVRFVHHAGNARDRAARDGAATKLEVVRSYECGLCRGFHVTSQAYAA
jgi:hypothetical protein